MNRVIIDGIVRNFEDRDRAVEYLQMMINLNPNYEWSIDKIEETPD